MERNKRVGLLKSMNTFLRKEPRGGKEVYFYKTPKGGTIQVSRTLPIQVPHKEAQAEEPKSVAQRNAPQAAQTGGGQGSTTNQAGTPQAPAVKPRPVDRARIGIAHTEHSSDTTEPSETGLHLNWTVHTHKHSKDKIYEMDGNKFQVIISNINKEDKGYSMQVRIYNIEQKRTSFAKTMKLSYELFGNPEELVKLSLLKNKPVLAKEASDKVKGMSGKELDRILTGLKYILEKICFAYGKAERG